MSTFTGSSLTPYYKTVAPSDDKMLKLYVDEQLRRIESSNKSVIAAVEQLQAEMALIWTELTALGHPRP